MPKSWRKTCLAHLLAADEDDEVILSEDGGSSGPEYGTTQSYSEFTEATHRQPSSASRLLVLAATVSSLGGILFGYDIGIIAGALLQLRTDFALSCWQQEIVVSSMLLGAMVSSLIGGFLVDLVGRRRTIIINAAIFVFGALLITAAPWYWFLVIGRLILGFAVALSAVAECTYISEISPVKRRGLLVSLNELGIVLGFLLAYLVDYAFICTPSGWRYMFGLSVFPALLQGFGMIFLPESPRYLLLKDDCEQAKLTLLKLGVSPTNVDTLLEEMTAAIQSEKEYSLFDLCRQKGHMRRRMVIAVGLVILQQCTGQTTVLYYAPTVLQTVGYSSNAVSTLATVAVGISKLISCIVALVLLDKVGRRRLLVIGTCAMAVSILTLGVLTLKMHDLQIPHTCDEEAVNRTSCDTDVQYSSANHTLGPHIGSQGTGNYKAAYLLLLLIFVAGYEIGFGTGTWLMLSEIFPSAVRGRAIALVTVMNWGSNFIITLTFLQQLEYFGISWTFLPYGFICVLSVLFIVVFVPETKGKSLEEISLSFTLAKW